VYRVNPAPVRDNTPGAASRPYNYRHRKAYWIDDTNWGGIDSNCGGVKNKSRVHRAVVNDGFYA